ncbi:MAG: 4Fe-4S binding protein [Bacteroidales bacterium]|nr:4Fe-4S binding protein [Bacteroidales bacterium]
MAHKISEDCAACGTCISECPVGAIAEGDIYSIDPAICIDCGTCAGVCPMGAIAPEE